MVMRTSSPWMLLLRLAAVVGMLLGAMQAARAEDDFLDPEVAFKLAARAADERTVEVTLNVAPGYYLYREQFKFEAADATLGAPVLPQGKTKFDETFQKTVETYRDVVRIAIPVQHAPARFRLLVTSQGCADKGLCYPPLQRGVDVGLAGFGGDGATRVLNAADTAAARPSLALPRSSAVEATAPATAAVLPPPATTTSTAHCATASSGLSSACSCWPGCCSR
jgi:thiol:disulfide interchange protein DsbD